MLNTIPVLVKFQILAVILTALFYTVLSPDNTIWLYSVYIFGFSHYFLATYYSRQKLTSLLASPKHYLALMLLVLLGYLSYTYFSSIMLYFGVHHALSEGYLRQRLFKVGLEQKLLSSIQATSFIIHLSGFILLINTSAAGQFNALVVPAFIALTIASIYFTWLVWQQKHQLNTAQLLSITGSELLLMVILLISIVHPITFLQIVFYHFTFWALMPFLSIASGDKSTTKPLMIYISLALVSLFLFTVISPIYDASYLKIIAFQKWFLILSYAHITLSFALSMANPSWINARFRIVKA